MERRDFIKTSSLAFTGLWLGAGTLSGCSKVDLSGSQHRVIIIGAGVAGLAAAYTLRKAGLQNITILEASNRIGGRVFTNHDLGFPIDLGASWIHGTTNRNPIKELAKESGMDLFYTDDESVKVFDEDGTQYTDGQLDPAERTYTDRIREVINSGDKNKSLRERLLEIEPTALDSRLNLYFLSSYDEFDYGTDSSLLSSLYYQEDRSFRGKDEIVTNGYDRLARRLAKNIQILYRQPVSSVEQTGTEWKVTTPGLDHFADEVIVAVPLSVLKAGAIQFTPALPDTHIQAMGRMQMGVVNKVILQWDAPFWQTDLTYIGYTPSTKGKYNYFLNLQKVAGKPCLMTFAFGDYATEMETHSDAQVQADIMQHLRAIYGNTIPDPTALLRSNWGSDPLFGGAYTAAVKGMEGNEFSTLSEPAGDRLHLVGEHTSQNYRGTVHGAYLSGEAVAERIMDRLDP